VHGHHRRWTHAKSREAAAAPPGFARRCLGRRRREGRGNGGGAGGFPGVAGCRRSGERGGYATCSTFLYTTCIYGLQSLSFRIWACIVFTYYFKLYHSFFSFCLDLGIFCFNQIPNSTIVG
jgi:hypothetical protein